MIFNEGNEDCIKASNICYNFLKKHYDCKLEIDDDKRFKISLKSPKNFLERLHLSMARKILLKEVKFALGDIGFMICELRTSDDDEITTIYFMVHKDEKEKK